LGAAGFSFFGAGVVQTYVAQWLDKNDNSST